MEVFSVINLTQFKYYQESFGYLAQQLNFPEKLTNPLSFRYLYQIYFISEKDMAMPNRFQN